MAEAEADAWDEGTPVDFAPGGAAVEEAGSSGGAHGVHLDERLDALEQLVADHREAVHVSLRRANDMLMVSLMTPGNGLIPDWMARMSGPVN